MGSNRLPGKVLAPVRDEPMLSLIVARIRLCQLIGPIVVATTDHARDDAIVELCQHLNIPVFRGDEHDVLGRYYLAALHFEAKSIVRVTADCPFIDPEIVDCVVALLERTAADYASNTIVRTYPDGLDVEVFAFPALARAHHEARAGTLREHVTLYFTGKRSNLPFGQFDSVGLMLTKDLSKVQWSVNLPEDLERVRTLAQLTNRFSGWKEIFQKAQTYNLLPKVLQPGPTLFV